jgi:lipopolysaccharide export system protein LptA
MKPLPKKNFPFFLLTLIALFGAVYFFLGGPKEPKYEKSAARAKVISESHDQQFKKFNLTGFDDKGQKFWKLEGDTAKVDIGDTVFLEDNVTLNVKGDTTIKTDHVTWTQQQGVFKTNAPVYVKHQSTKIHGVGAFGRLNDSFIQLNRDIEMLLSPTARLTCVGPMKIFYAQNKMVLYRSVKVTDERGSVSSNRMDVFFDAEQNKAKEIIAVGNVLIEREGDTTRSKRAIYILATGAVRLEGSPEITLHKTPVLT